jgi:thiol-disulfide isomerase/thioredoxin
MPTAALPPLSSASLPSPPDLLVACLCAQWCGTCRDYRALFEPLQAEFAAAQFVWVDIEDQADLVDPVEVDNFPTLLVVADGRARFFGTLTPHIDTLRRILQTQLGADAAPHPDAQVQAMAQRLRAHLAANSPKEPGP